MLDQYLMEIRYLHKAKDRPGPPGPPPSWNPSLIWKPESSRWVLPDHLQGTHVPESITGMDEPMRLIAGEISWDEYMGMSVERDDLSGDDLIRANPEVNPGLTWYIADGYKTINDVMRGNSSVHGAVKSVVPDLNRYMLSVDAMIEDMDRLMQPLEEGRHLFRGQKNMFYENLQPGDTLPMDSFVSTSRNAAVARRFSMGHGSFFHLLIGDEAVKGVDVSGAEAETVLSSGLSVEVLGSRDVDLDWGEGPMTLQFILGRVRA